MYLERYAVPVPTNQPRPGFRKESSYPAPPVHLPPALIAAAHMSVSAAVNERSASTPLLKMLWITPMLALSKSRLIWL